MTTEIDHIAGEIQKASHQLSHRTSEHNDRVLLALMLRLTWQVQALSGEGDKESVDASVEELVAELKDARAENEQLKQRLKQIKEHRQND